MKKLIIALVAFSVSAQMFGWLQIINQTGKNMRIYVKDHTKYNDGLNSVSLPNGKSFTFTRHGTDYRKFVGPVRFVFVDEKGNISPRKVYEFSDYVTTNWGARKKIVVGPGVSTDADGDPIYVVWQTIPRLHISAFKWGSHPKKQVKVFKMQKPEEIGYGGEIAW